MHHLIERLIHYGLPFVFANVLTEQLGLPVPAIPTLVVAGALAAQGRMSAAAILAVAVLGSVIADSTWYLLGRRHGNRVLKTVCRISLSPDSCVRQTETIFERWGAPSLLLAKFIPGFSTVAPPLAGATKVAFAPFLLLDAGGALLWAGTGVLAGWIFHPTIDRIAEFLESLGAWALAVLAAALLLFVAAKWWQRRRFFKALRMARISVEELHRLMDQGEAPVVVDVRNSGARSRDPRSIPGAILIDAAAIDERIRKIPPEREIILYCT
jgi:membrane protein DedA with SNARE-associated domain